MGANQSWGAPSPHIGPGTMEHSGREGRAGSLPWSPSHGAHPHPSARHHKSSSVRGRTGSTLVPANRLGASHYRTRVGLATCTPVENEEEGDDEGVPPLEGGGGLAGTRSCGEVMPPANGSRTLPVSCREDLLAAAMPLLLLHEGGPILVPPWAGEVRGTAADGEGGAMVLPLGCPLQRMR